MDKDTKIELLKILGMIIILAALICGIVWLNKAQDISANEANVLVEQSETTTNEESITKVVSENNSKTENKTK